jgi:hypothetical protein
MYAIKAAYKVKKDSIDPPTIYLGAGVEDKEINGVTCWTMSSEKYVRAAVSNLDKELAGQGLRLRPKCPTPMTSGYRPELNTTAELKDKDGSGVNRRPAMGS